MRRGILALAFVTGAGAAAEAAVTAEVEGGVLVVRGDAADDEVAIAPSPAGGGRVRVEAVATGVNGEDFADFTGVTSLDVDLGAGADLVRIGGTSPSARLAVRSVLVVGSDDPLDLGLTTLTVRGNVEVRCGAGADQVDLGDVAVGGGLFVDLDPREGAPGLADTFGVLNSAVRGDVDVFCGGGDDTVTIASQSAEPGPRTSFRRSVHLDLGADDDFASVVGVDVTGALRIAGGGGDDVVGALTIASFAGPLRLGSLDADLGEGANQLLLGSTSTPGTRCGALTLTGGAGTDVHVIRNAEVRGALNADLGAGGDTLRFQDAAVFKGVTAELGAGADLFSATNTQFRGTVAADGEADAVDRVLLDAGIVLRKAPVFSGFEQGDGAFAALNVRDAGDPSDRLSLNLATGAFELFLDGASQGTGTATLAAKGANVLASGAAGGATFAAKVTVTNWKGSCPVRGAGGASLAKIKDANVTD